MDNQSDVRRVSIRNLLLAILRAWRPLLAVAMILGLLAAGAKGALAISRAGDAQQRAQETQAYEAARETYEARLADMNDRVESLERGIRSQQEYLSDSILMNLDPYHVFEGTVSMYITTDYKVITDSVVQDVDETITVLVLYSTAINGGEFLEPVARQMNLAPIYLQELVTAVVEVLGGIPRPVVTVKVRGESEEQVRQILDGICAQLDTLSGEIAEKSVEHRTSITVENVREYVDQNLVTQQKTAYDNMDKQSNSLKLAQEELNALEEPSAPSYAKRSIVKGAVKYGIVFGLAGFLAVAFFVSVRFIAGDRLYDGAEIVYRCNLKVLGNVATKRPGRCKLDRKLWKLEGRGTAGDGRIYEVIAAQIRNAMDPKGTLLLAGQADNAVLETVAKQLSQQMPGVEIRTGGSLLTDAQTILALPACTCVVLVEQCGLSRYSLLNRQAGYIREMGKDLIGCIAVDA